MKKILLLSTMLLVTLLTGAQTKVSPKMVKGDKKVYVTEMTTTIPGQQSKVTITSETLYEVLDATADGYVIDCMVTDAKTTGDEGDIASRLISMSTEMLKNAHTRFATDKDGKVTKILNYEEVKAGIEKTISDMLDELYKVKPEAAAMFTREALMEQMRSMITEDMLLQSTQVNSSPLALNGKTIATGAQDEFNNAQGMKMKRMYYVNADGSIITSSVLNMNKEEMKQMIIDQVGKLFPDQAEMIKNSIDMVINNPSFKMEANEKATYTFNKDGWVESIKSEVSSSTMGQKLSAIGTTTLKK